MITRELLAGYMAEAEKEQLQKLLSLVRERKTEFQDLTAREAPHEFVTAISDNGVPPNAASSAGCEESGVKESTRASIRMSTGLDLDSSPETDRPVSALAVAASKEIISNNKKSHNSKSSINKSSINKSSSSSSSSNSDNKKGSTDKQTLQAATAHTEEVEVLLAQLLCGSLSVSLSTPSSLGPHEAAGLVLSESAPELASRLPPTSPTQVNSNNSAPGSGRAGLQPSGRGSGVGSSPSGVNDSVSTSRSVGSGTNDPNSRASADGSFKLAAYLSHFLLRSEAWSGRHIRKIIQNIQSNVLSSER